jgi:CxxC-x17-CxxC domain-containing protein
LKLMIDGVAGRPFSAETIPPFPKLEKSNKEKIIKVSRERYSTPGKIVEDKISRWAGVLKLPEEGTPSSPVLYDVQCALCGKWTKVIFPPDGARPVYCKSCLKKIERERETKKTTPPISLEEAAKSEPVSFSPSKKVKEIKEKSRRSRAEVNVEELKKVLEESLKKNKK